MAETLSFEERMDAVKKIMAKANKERQTLNPGAPPAMMMAKDHPRMFEKSYLPTGCEAWDRALGGGLRLGMGHQIVGGAGIGKSSMALSVIKQGLLRGKTACLISTESAIFPVDQADSVGLTREEQANILFMPVYGYGEVALNNLRDLLYDKGKGVPRYIMDIIVIDSITGFVPKAVMDSVEDKGLEGNTMARLAAMSSKFYPIVLSILNPEGLLLTINQIRMQDIQTYATEGATAGHAPKFYNKTITFLRPDNEEQKKLVYINERTKKPERTGNAVWGVVSKNNAGGRPGATFKYRYFFGKGFDTLTPIFEEALDLNIIEQTSKVSYNVPKPDGTIEKTSGGRDAARAILETNPDIYAHVTNLVRSSRTTLIKDLPTEAVKVDPDTGEILEDTVPELPEGFLE